MQSSAKKSLRNALVDQNSYHPRYERPKDSGMHSRGNITSHGHLKTRRPRGFVRNHIETVRRKSVLNHFNQLCINAAGNDF